MDTNEHNKDITENTDTYVETSRMGQSALQADITGANAEAVTTTATIQKLETVSATLSQSISGSELYSIKTFLERPQIISFGNLSSATAWPSLVYSGIFPGALLSTTMMQDKTKGIWGLKATMVATLAVNAQRFQQGRYILGVIPIAGSTITSPDYLVTHRASRTQATQVPHVEIDINCDTEVTLEVPHISCFFACPIRYSNTIQYQNCQLFVAPYGPLKSGPSTLNCDYILTVRLKDVELFAPVVPQSGSGFVGTVKRKVPSDNEQEYSGSKPLSSSLKIAATATGILSKIPVLSSVAAPASWALNVAGQVASAFGWSRPHNGEKNALMQMNNFANMANVDAIDNAEVLGYSNDNKVETLPGFAGTDLDELSLAFIAQKQAFYQAVTWNVSDPENTLLHSRECHPKSFFSQSTYGAHTTFNLTPMAFAANFFALYRGSIVITLKIVKTEFHSGRLLLAFAPNEIFLNTPAVTTFENSAYTFREIIDIRYGNEYSFVIPYTCFNQYRDTIGNQCSYGTIFLRVLNELRAPDTCAQNVDILIEAGAYKDMEFAKPSTPRGFPTLVATAQSGGRKVTFKDEDPCKSLAKVMGNATLSDTDFPARVCIGERITSLRQILKKYSFVQPRVERTPSPVNPYFTTLPFAMPVSHISAANARVHSETYPDNFVHVCSAYGLFRGGVRLKFITGENMTDRYIQTSLYHVTTDTSAVTNMFSANASPPGIFDIQQTCNLPTTVDRINSRGGVEIEVPYYNRTFASPVYNAQIVSALSFDYNPGAPVPSTRVYAIGFGAGITTTYRVYRAASDDFDVGLFISVPPYLEWGFTGGA